METSDAGREERPVQETRMHLHLLDMLVLEIESVGTKNFAAVIGGRVILEFSNHSPAAAGIARYRVAGHRPFRRDDPAAHQWAHDREKPRRIAARIGDA